MLCILVAFFQQYLIDSYIQMDCDYIEWIKNNQKKIFADQYAKVTCFINELAKKDAVARR